MSTPADRYRRIADRCRGLPAQHGLREHSVFLVESSWSGAALGDGELTEVATPILVHGKYPPKVRYPNQREIALGLMSEGSLVVGPFTPTWGAGGFDRSKLDGTLLDTGETLHIRVVGPQAPNGVRYRIKNCNVDHALRVTLTCVPAAAEG